MFLLFLMPGMVLSQQEKKKKHKKDKKLEAVSRVDKDDDDKDDMSLDEDEPRIRPKPVMSHALSLHLSMGRDGSGTSWNPDVAPFCGWKVEAGQWVFMFRGDIFARYNTQDITKAGARGATQWDAPDMLTGMIQRRVGESGLFHFNLKMSAEAPVTDSKGYPLLFQNGGQFENKWLTDRQLPNDLFSELSVSYAQAITKKTDAYLYIGYPGEPALGPVFFMQRPSSQYMPDAPLGHNWTDATHISFGVATAGVRIGKVKIEGSVFNSRQPDENRYDFDQPRVDSRSARLSFNPSIHWAAQVSTGFIKSPDVIFPDDNINRNTASLTYVTSVMRHDSYAALTALWGQNTATGQITSTSALIEGTYKEGKMALYGRYEWVQKTAEDLALKPPFIAGESIFYPVSALTMGVSYDLFHISTFTLAAGTQLSVTHPDSRLYDTYGHYPISGEAYLHVYFSKLK